MLVTAAEATAASLGFSRSSYQVMEEALEIRVTLVRQGDSSASAAVIVNTGPATPLAKKQNDYLAIENQIVNFLANETEKSILISIVNDEIPEFIEKFQLILSDPTGDILGERATTEIIISDSDLDFTSVVDYLDKGEINQFIDLPASVDLEQKSLVDSNKTMLEILNEISIINQTNVPVSQNADGSLVISTDLWEAYLNPVSILKNNKNSSSNVLNYSKDNNFEFRTKEGWLIYTYPTLSEKGFQVLQKFSSQNLMPKIIVTKKGNITIQVDQFIAPYELDAARDVVVNFSFYTRWNLKPSAISLISNEKESGVYFIPHPDYERPIQLKVVYEDAGLFREQILRTAPIDGINLLERLNDYGLDRCGNSSKKCLQIVKNPFITSDGFLEFEIDLADFNGVMRSYAVSLFADYKIRKAPNFTQNSVNFTEVLDLDKDGFPDFKMTYENGEEQYFFTMSVKEL